MLLYILYRDREENLIEVNNEYANKEDLSNL